MLQSDAFILLRHTFSKAVIQQRWTSHMWNEFAHVPIAIAMLLQSTKFDLCQRRELEIAISVPSEIVVTTWIFSSTIRPRRVGMRHGRSWLEEAFIECRHVPDGSEFGDTSRQSLCSFVHDSTRIVLAAFKGSHDSKALLRASHAKCCNSSVQPTTCTLYRS